MKRKIGVALSFALLVMSCSSEKVNLSPISDSLSEEVFNTSNAAKTTETIAYQSEISNLIASFPKMGNDAVDREVAKLKTALHSYLNSLAENNLSLHKKALKNYTNAYVKIQKLRKYLNVEKDEVLNRYLVRLKTNVNMLEAIN